MGYLDSDYKILERTFFVNRNEAHFGDLSESFAGAYTTRRAVLLFLGMLLIFCLLVNHSWKATPDSALYLELGESLASEKGFVYNEMPHTYVPPGFPYILKLWIGFFGNDFFSYRVLMSLMGWLTGLIGISLVARLYGADLGITVGGLFAINHTIVLNSTYTSSDIAFTLFCLVSFHFAVSYVKNRDSLLLLVFSGLMAGIPALIRVNGWGLPPALAIFIWCNSDPATTRFKIVRCAAFIFLAFLLPVWWEIYKTHFPLSEFEGEYLRAVTGRSLETQITVILQSMWEYVFETAYALTGVSTRTGLIEGLLCLGILWGLISAIKRGERLFTVFTLIQMSGLFLSSAGSRYMAPLIPGLYLFLGLGTLSLVGILNKYFAKTIVHPQTLTRIVFAILVITNLGADFQTIYHARNAAQREGGESSKDISFFSAAKWIKDTKAEGPLLSMNPRILRYLTGIKTIDLLKSGVPEHLAWTSTEDEINVILQKYDPEYLFSDAKNQDLQEIVFESIRKSGRDLIEIKEAKVGERFGLWKILKQKN